MSKSITGANIQQIVADLAKRLIAAPSVTPATGEGPASGWLETLLGVTSDQARLHAAIDELRTTFGARY